PIVYCLEEVDNGALLFDITVAKEENFELDFSDKSGAPAVFADGFRRNADEFTSLYRRVKETRVPQRLRFIPYFSFANRGTTDMLVWVRHE
ncbi:MAG: glycoside hydrolase family 127 protein, partial [Clostridiales bacterium]|nr:glycoside hydrolase family 127 protein [Clostridiales bacterium]